MHRSPIPNSYPPVEGVAALDAAVLMLPMIRRCGLDGWVGAATLVDLHRAYYFFQPSRALPTWSLDRRRHCAVAVVPNVQCHWVWGMGP